MFKTDTEIVDSIITAINTSKNNITPRPISKATQTTLLGNSNAQQTATSLIQLTTSLKAGLSKDLTRLKNIATEFQKVEDTMQNTIQNNITHKGVVK